MFYHNLYGKGASLVAQLVKTLPAMQETPGRRPGEGNVFLPGESPWTEEPGELQPMG